MLSGHYSKELKGSSSQELGGWYPTEVTRTDFGDANNFSIFERRFLWTTTHLNKENKIYNFNIQFPNFWQVTTKRVC